MDDDSVSLEKRLKHQEWLETDGRGGFACGTALGVRTRRYHGLLIPAVTPPTGRFVLVNGFDAWVRTPEALCAISSQHYPPDVVQPDGFKRLKRFVYKPWPRWSFALEDGTEISQEIFIAKEAGATVVSWRLVKPKDGVVLSLRPFLSGRDYHALHRENPSFNFEPQSLGQALIWRPYAGVCGAAVLSNGSYAHAPLWYRQFLYEEEKSRGLDCVEDLASPGVFRWDLSAGPAFWILVEESRLKDAVSSGALDAGDIAALGKNLRESESLRRQRGSPLKQAAEAYVAVRGQGLSIIAGYPWFTDWGRDAFVSLRGLCLATGRLAQAKAVLLEWTRALYRGLAPNRFPDNGASPEYTSVDASLWLCVAIHEFLRHVQNQELSLSAEEERRLKAALEAVASGYAAGSLWGIGVDPDGLLRCGDQKTSLTWMDARVNGAPVTGRAGKPVEVQALWINALLAAGIYNPSWNALARKAQDSFARRFWNQEKGCLYDIIDAGGEEGKVEDLIRPNQIFAVGGLPWPILSGEKAKAVTDLVERELWTPLGLRTLAAQEPGYRPRYEGGPRERDFAYHQGTAWPWLLGAFVEAWVRVRNNSKEAKLRARQKFLAPLLRHLDDAGLGHVSEIADGQAPFTPRGCPFQAWSVGEALRLDLSVLALKDGVSKPKENAVCKSE